MSVDCDVTRKGAWLFCAYFGGALKPNKVHHDCILRTECQNDNVAGSVFCFFTVATSGIAGGKRKHGTKKAFFPLTARQKYVFQTAGRTKTTLNLSYSQSFFCIFSLVLALNADKNLPKLLEQ